MQAKQALMTWAIVATTGVIGASVHAAPPARLDGSTLIDVDGDSVAERGSVVADGYALEWVPLEEWGIDPSGRAAVQYNSMDGGFSTAYTEGSFEGPALIRDDYALEGASAAAEYLEFRFAGGVALDNMVIEFRWRDLDTNLMGSQAVQFPQAGNFGYTITLNQPLTMLDNGYFELRSGTPEQNGASSWTRFTWISAASAPSVGENTGAPGVGDGTVEGTVWAFAFTTTPACVADFNGDSVVDGADLGALLGLWGSDAIPADLNADGVVDGGDLGLLLGAWGPCP